jgi:hypothetical protein
MKNRQFSLEEEAHLTFLWRHHSTLKATHDLDAHEMSTNIQYISDIHMEHRGLQVPTSKIQPSAPILVLAGDIGRPGSKGLQSLLAYVSSKFQHVVWVVGNHEHYGFDYDEIWTIIAADLQPFPNLHLLQRGTWDLPGTNLRIAGATLWSEIDTFTYRQLNDRKNICGTDKKPWSRENMVLEHKRDRLFFETAIDQARNDNKRLLCVSHHAPSFSMGMMPGDELSSGFCSNLEACFRPPVVGHTHISRKVWINGIPCVSNCLGYPQELGTTGYCKNATLCV